LIDVHRVCKGKDAASHHFRFKPTRLKPNHTVFMLPKCLLLLLLLFVDNAIADTALQPPSEQAVLLQAVRVFDGVQFRDNTSVLIANGRVQQIGPTDSLKVANARLIDLGDAMLLPGFIELHAHLDYQHIPADIVLRHGITTVRNVGGPVYPPHGGDGNLRMLASGPIITAAQGYPIVTRGALNLALPVASAEQAKMAVDELVKGGAVVIKVALEPGGEHGAPWMQAHGHQPDSHSQKPAAWPMLSTEIVRAIVEEAHKLGRRVTAHVAERKGVKIAVAAGVDEWAHIPCNPIPTALLKQAVAQQVALVTTMDTLSHCSGIQHNARTWAALGGQFLYGAEIAHPEIPWGIDAQELAYMIHLAGLPPLEVLRTVTAKAGAYLNIPLLGTLQPGAPADLIAVKGDINHSFKALEYPDLVMSGGKLVVNNFVK